MNSAKAPSRRGLLLKAGLLFNGAAGVVLGVPIVRYLLSPLMSGKGADSESWLSLGSLDEACRLSKSGRVSERWPDREYTLLGAASRRRKIPGVRYKLRAPGMPRPLVSAVRLIHVPVPWRRLLRGWLARLRASRARTVRVRL